MLLSEKAKVEQTYDEAEHKLTLTVSEAGCPSSVYTVTFEGQSKEAAYQIANADFENWTDDENAKIAEGWNSFDTAAGLFALFALYVSMPQKIEGYKGNGVRIVSKDLCWGWLTPTETSQLVISTWAAPILLMPPTITSLTVPT